MTITSILLNIYNNGANECEVISNVYPAGTVGQRSVFIGQFAAQAATAGKVLVYTLNSLTGALLITQSA